MPTIESLSSVRNLTIGSLWNGASRLFSIMVALVATPVLLHQLGVERWGLFTFALTVASIFGILDFGVSLALTRALAVRIGTPAERDAAPLIVVSFVLLAAISVSGAVLADLLVPFFIRSVLHVPSSLQSEAIVAFRVLAMSWPLIVINAAMWSVLSAYQKFRVGNLVNIPLGCLYFVGPMLVLLVQRDLVSVTLALVAARVVQTLVYGVLTLQAVPDLRQRTRLDFNLLTDLLRIGKWMIISNMLTPIGLHVDRLIVGMMLPLVDLSHYATPLDLVLRFSIVPIAICVSFFPAVATSYSTMPLRAGRLLRIGSLVTIAIVFPACLVVVGFAQAILTLWLGAAFAVGSYNVLTFLGIGAFFTCITILPNSLLEAIGRPAITATLIICQMILFIPLLVLLTTEFGIQGAAVAWTMRSVIYCVAILYMCAKTYPQVARTIDALYWVIAGAGADLMACSMIRAPRFRLTIITISAVAVLLLAALTLLEKQELGQVRRVMRRLITGARTAS